MTLIYDEPRPLLSRDIHNKIEIKANNCEPLSKLKTAGQSTCVAREAAFSTTNERSKVRIIIKDIEFGRISWVQFRNSSFEIIDPAGLHRNYSVQSHYISSALDIYISYLIYLSS